MSGYKPLDDRQVENILRFPQVLEPARTLL